MPRLACRTCGRQLDILSPIESLSAEELRCPRCGARLETDRREADRRKSVRQVDPSDERRVADRRTTRHRGGEAPPES
jgi:DNA-directed RNA polymerase subunit RPC12/RpoP